MYIQTSLKASFRRISCRLLKSLDWAWAWQSNANYSNLLRSVPWRGDEVSFIYFARCSKHSSDHPSTLLALLVKLKHCISKIIAHNNYCIFHPERNSRSVNVCLYFLGLGIVEFRSIFSFQFILSLYCSFLLFQFLYSHVYGFST